MTGLLWASVGVPGVASAQGARVDYDFKTNENMTFTRSVKAGDEIDVSIANLCDGFEVSYFGVKPEAKSSLGAAKKVGESRPWECIVSATPKKVLIPHQSRFGGYVVQIQRDAGPMVALIPKAGVEREKIGAMFEAELAKIVTAHDGKHGFEEEREAAESIGELKTLHDVTLVIAVNQPTWNYELSGGFTSTWRTDPQFAIVKQDDGSSVVTRETDKEDHVKLSAAAFVSVYHERKDWLALSLGLGVNNGSQLSLFVGPSVRLGGKAFVTAGWNWGSVTRLPNGVELGKPAPTENALSNLPTQVKGGFFVGFSYSFLSPGEAVLKKPLAPPTKAEAGNDGKP